MLSLYKGEVKKLALQLYSKEGLPGKYVLDKTPRYYHILPELLELFPKAKFVLLQRNPLSVFASILGPVSVNCSDESK